MWNRFSKYVTSNINRQEGNGRPKGTKNDDYKYARRMSICCLNFLPDLVKQADDLLML